MAETHPVDEMLPAPRLAALGLQHVLVMYAGAVAVPLIISGALGLSPEQRSLLINADLLAFTLDKTSGQFSPTTRYRDYAIDTRHIHWESQSRTRANSPTGLRYQQHKALGTDMLLFARESADERALWFIGRGCYVQHEDEAPMAITWQLEQPLPGDLFAAFAAAVA